MDELTEGMDALAKRREMSKVYVVVRQDFDDRHNVFCRIFFKRALAEDWIHGLTDSEDYRIETYKEQEDGSTIEIY